MSPQCSPEGRPDQVLATITPAAASGIDWHCVVIGGGPAGATTAIRLSRGGLRVLLVDRSAMPRPKVCGCCLSPLAVAELTSLCSPGPLPTRLPLDTVRVVSGGRSARIPMPGGAVVSRETLDAALVRRAIAAGAEWLPNMLAETIHEDPADHHAAGVTVVARGTSAETETPVRLHARVAVIAAGLADTIQIRSPARTAARDRRDRHVTPSSRIGVGTTLANGDSVHGSTALDLPAGELVMAVGRHGYCGLVRLEDGRLDLAAAVDRHALAGDGGPAAGIARLLASAAGDGRCLDGLHRLGAALSAAAFRATPPLTHHSARIAGATGRIFRVGDAAGYVEPFTGEGIGWALADGRLLAESLLSQSLLDDTATAADRYRRAHARLLAGRHARCRWVARGIRHPGIVSGAVRLAALMPWAAKQALPLLVGAALPRNDGRERPCS